MAFKITKTNGKVYFVTETSPSTCGCPKLVTAGIPADPSTVPPTPITPPTALDATTVLQLKKDGECRVSGTYASADVKIGLNGKVVVVRVSGVVKVDRFDKKEPCCKNEVIRVSTDVAGETTFIDTVLH